VIIDLLLCKSPSSHHYSVVISNTFATELNHVSQKLLLLHTLGNHRQTHLLSVPKPHTPYPQPHSHHNARRSSPSDLPPRNLIITLLAPRKYHKLSIAFFMIVNTNVRRLLFLTKSLPQDIELSVEGLLWRPTTRSKHPITSWCANLLLSRRLSETSHDKETTDATKSTRSPTRLLVSRGTRTWPLKHLRQTLTSK
jgi:hypothetical protein